MGVKAISFSMMSDQSYHASFSLLFSSLFHLHFLCSITMGWHATIETQKLSLSLFLNCVSKHHASWRPWCTTFNFQFTSRRETEPLICRGCALAFQKRALGNSTQARHP